MFDEFGDPVAGARVQAMRYQMVQGARRLSPVGANAQSDDTGAFRLYGLMPGDYYVSAILRAFPGDSIGNPRGRIGQPIRSTAYHEPLFERARQQ